MTKPVQASTYNFRHLIEGGFIYVDKTRLLYELVNPRAGVYFLARPRRFGKSLLISTLKSLFQGHRELFKGLWIDESDYAWEAHPVIHIDFSRYHTNSAADVARNIQRFSQQIANDYQITLIDDTFDAQFVDLVIKLGREKQVVLLIDEYDKPILDNINDLPTAQAVRDTLKSFYTTVKSLDAYLRFVFITGISKFSRVGIFSGMNHLNDITMNSHFGTLLGITDGEIRDYFGEHIAQIATQENVSQSELLQRMQNWYNGYRFAADCENVYNPFSTLQFFFHRRFSNFWFETGTPTFLIKLIKERDFDIGQLDYVEVSEIEFSTYEIEHLSLLPLLFQTGYLTIKGVQQDLFGDVFTLSYPNFEVKNAFVTYLLSAYNEMELILSQSHLRKLVRALQVDDLERFFEILSVFFANIDYDLQLDYEKYYQTIFYLIFLLIGVHISAEVKTNRGRVDAIIELQQRIFVFEFKLNQSADEALQQIKNHEYARKYRQRGKPLTLIGANFDTAKREVVEWTHERED